MRVVLILVCAVLIMVLLGWMTFSRNSGEATININTQKIEQDTQRVIDRGDKLIHDADKKGQELLRPNRRQEAQTTPD